MACKLAEARLAVLTKTVLSANPNLTFAVNLISEFTDFMDIREHKCEALATLMSESDMYDGDGDKPFISLDHAGKEMLIGQCTDNGIMQEEFYAHGTFIGERDFYCYLTNRDVKIYDQTPVVVIGTSWADLADSLLHYLEERCKLCVLCANCTTNKSEICSNCLFRENKTKCLHCKRSFGMFSKEPGAGAYHPVCKRQRQE